MKKNSLKHFFKLLMLTILAGLTNASCQGKYPKLEDGMQKLLPIKVRW